MIKIRKDTPRRTVNVMVEHLFNFIESGGKESTMHDLKENLSFDMKKEDDQYSIEIMGNVIEPE